MSRDTDYSVLFNQLLEVDGPFLTVPVARGAFGKLLEKTEQSLVDELRIARQELIDDETLLPRWIRWVLTRLLDYEDDVLVEGPPIAHLSHLAPEGVTLRPDLALLDPEADGVRPVMLITEWPADQVMNRKAGKDRWNASPIARLVELCQATKVPLGLTTNGASWTLVHAPIDGAVSTINWEAELWLDERETLDLFVTSLGAQRFFGVDTDETLLALLEESADGAEEVTTTLGRQVRQSVELLVAALSEANRERQGELLEDVSPEEVYRGAVTVMMRLVFLLSAEERGLFLLGDDVYDAHYAISTMLDQLEEEPDPDVLFGRFDAWPRILATFRLIHGGVQHDQRLNLPAYGGRLFDPDRYPFLEGRLAAQSPGDNSGIDVGTTDERLLNAINNRVMLEVLRSLQRLSLDRFNETRRLSFRHLDVEQIGTVYEGLLDHTCEVASEPTLGLLAKRSAKKGNTEPEIALSELEAKAAEGRSALEKWLKDEHGFNNTELKKLDNEPDELARKRLESACGNDGELAARVEPFFGVLRIDLRGLPSVFLTDSFVVTDSRERSDTGAHYTPRSIAERIVTHALDPLVYEPGPHNEGDRSQWKLRPWSEIVDLKVVDPACGSGAMLVSACRYLADRLVEAWQSEALKPGVALPLPGAQGAPLVLPSEEDDWTMTAMRVVADRCLYGVDVNDMAVEMCKLSLWLATLAKGKPFSFLDHSIRHGDSLLGVADLGVLSEIGTDGSGTASLLLERLRTFVDRAKDKRLDLLAMPTIDARDLDEKHRLLAEADRELAVVRTVADALTGAKLSTADGKADERATRMTALADQVSTLFPSNGEQADPVAATDLADRASYWLDVGRPVLTPARVPFHWPLAFPEVFLGKRARFDATVSNPPFLGGQKIAPTFGSNYRELLVWTLAGGTKGSADLVAYFFLRAAQIARCTGYVATNTIGQGETSHVGLTTLIDGGSMIYRAASSTTWPGDASVEVSLVWLIRRNWTQAPVLDRMQVDGIDEMLYQRSPSGWRNQRLASNRALSFQGATILGKGFLMSPQAAEALIEEDMRNSDVLFPYLGGEDLNKSPTHAAPRWAINFFDWPKEKAQLYPACFEIVEQKVKPERAKHLTKKYQISQRRGELWWLYSADAAALTAATADLDRVLAICMVSKSVAPAFVPTGQVLAMTTVVFAYDDDFHFGVLSSGFHYRWACRYASSLRNDLRYAPSDVFETFPQPKYSAGVESAGQALDEHRSARMIEAEEGLTDTYNRVHSPDDRTPEIIRLRELHLELDQAVAEAYGWSDLELDHGFHPVRGQGIRYTFSPDAAVEVLYRLLELNRTRYEAEVAQGLHDKKGGAKRAAKKRTTAQTAAQSETLFE